MGKLSIMKSGALEMLCYVVYYEVSNSSFILPGAISIINKFVSFETNV